MPSYPELAEVEPARPATETKPSASPVYRHFSAKDGFPKLEVSTLYELMERSLKKYSSNQCLGSRVKGADGKVGPYVFKSYAEVGTEIANVASGLAGLGIKTQQSVGVFGQNSAEWMISMQACNRLNLRCVPLYDSLGENAVEYIINHSEAPVVFVQSEKLGQLVKALDKVQGTLKHVVVWGARNEALERTVVEKGFTLDGFKELQDKGAAAPVFAVPPAPSDICTIMYTSGTTGDPKGVLMSHSTVISGVTAIVSYNAVNKLSFNAADRLISYLPLAHIFDRINEEWFLYLGAGIGYWQGDILKLTEDIAELKPAIFIGVPRVFDRIYAKTMSSVKEGTSLKRFLFNWGYTRKLYYMRQGFPHDQSAAFFDKLIFSKVAARFGGNLKAVVSGGAPLAPHVEDFLRIAMCAPVAQGYGLTETCAASFIAASDATKKTVIQQSGTVGPPTPVTEFRLESVPDMKYDALDPEEPKGEVLIRGGSNFSGYFKNPEMTREVLEEDGWFHTGDIATILPSGAIKIVDRKKNIFKLSQGEYIAVEKLEAVYKKNSLVEQAWVYGNSFKSCVIGVVVPSPEFIKWANDNGIAGDARAVCASPKANEYMLSQLVTTGKGEKLKGFELLKAIHLEPNQFSIEEELLTPTFKFKRPQLQKKYQTQLDDMYKVLKE